MSPDAQAFDGFATQDSMRSAYGVLHDRMALEGTLHFSNQIIATSNNDLCLENDANEEFDIRICSKGELEICVGDGVDSVKEYYLISVGDDGVLAGDMAFYDETTEKETEYPLSEIALRGIMQKIDAARKPLHETPRERFEKLFSESELLFNRLATPEERQTYIKLNDEFRTLVDIDGLSSLNQKISDLKRKVLQRAHKTGDSDTTD